MGERGVGLLLPRNAYHGVWLVSYNARYLDGPVRSHTVHPGDRVALQYVHAADYWRADDWAGYVAIYDDLRRLADAEQRFWDELYGINKEGNSSWDALAKKRIRDQARELHRQYQGFFEGPAVPAVATRLYPNARDDISRFAKWFTEDEFHFPQFDVVLNGAGVWWNADSQLKVGVTLTCNGKRFATTKGQFTRAKDATNGEVDVSGVAEEERTFLWAPFEQIELLVRDCGFTSDTTLRHVVMNDFEGLIPLLGEQPLDRLEGADPEVSKVELLFHIRHGETAVRQDQCREFFGSLLPRVVGVVPADKVLPSLVAFGLWESHTPVTYQQSARIFEELYRARQGAEEERGALVRAIIGYFRCCDFQRASDLAKEFPSGTEISLADVDLVPPGVDAEYVRELGRVAVKLQQADAGSKDFKMAARHLFTWMSSLKLDYVVQTPESRRAFNAEHLRTWHSALTKRVRAEIADAQNVGDVTVRHFIEGHAKKTQAGLESLRDELNKDGGDGSNGVGKK